MMDIFPKAEKQLSFVFVHSADYKIVHILQTTFGQNQFMLLVQYIVLNVTKD